MKEVKSKSKVQKKESSGEEEESDEEELVGKNFGTLYYVYGDHD